MKRTTDTLRRAVGRRLDAVHGDSGVGSRTGPGAAGGASARAGGDRGMTAIEFVFLTPVLFFMIFATVQFGLYFFADHVALAAAQAGARKARAEADADPGGWSDSATDTARTYIRQLGPKLLTDGAIEPVQPDAATVGIRVTGNVPTIFPGLHFHVRELSQGPVERFVPDNPGG
ncbi:TadE-like protein [Streptomyces sp. DvalAA-14]|nr:pilus assembly protein [Streptomyces sp. SID4948]SCE45360.1 TadE-like protein [Streptomyces sp. DvalAA-14]